MAKDVPGARTFSAYAASGVAGIFAMAVLGLVTDRLNLPGLTTLRNYIVKDRA